MPPNRSHPQTGTVKALGTSLILDTVLLYLSICSGPRCHYVSDDVFRINNSTPPCTKRAHLPNLLNCLVVSKFWAAAVIPRLWGRFARTEDLLAAISNVARVYSGGDELWYPQKWLTPEQFPKIRATRICLYARYMRKINLTVGEFRETLSRFTYFEEILSVKKMTLRFPSTRIIHISDSLLQTSQGPEFLRILLSPVTRKLDLVFFNRGDPGLNNDGDLPSSEIISTYFKLLVQKSRNLTHLRISPPRFLQPASSALDKSAPLLSVMLALERLLLPTNWLTPQILSVLAELPSLRRLSLQCVAQAYLIPGAGDFENQERREDPQDSEFHLQSNGTFSALRDLSVCGWAHDFDSFVSEFFCDGHNLQALSVDCITGYEPVHDTFRRIANKFSDIQCLKIEFLWSRGRNQQCYRLSDLRPLMACRKMTSFSLESVILNDSELELLVGSWSSLTSLSIKRTPLRQLLEDVFDNDIKRMTIEEIPIGLTLGCLESLARSHPGLEEVSLTIQSSSTEHLSRSPPRFHQVVKLLFNSSFPNHRHRSFDLNRAAEYIGSFAHRDNTSVLMHYDDSLTSGGAVERVAYFTSYKKYLERFKSLIAQFRAIQCLDFHLKYGRR